MELLSLAVHHHSRTFYHDDPKCINMLINFISLIWVRAKGTPGNVLVGVLFVHDNNGEDG